MNVLSLFDGISCGQLALRRVGVNYDKYFASEIDKYAIKVTRANFPETIQLGDVRVINATNLPKIDLMIGGSPCQGFSFAGKRLNFDDPRSELFLEFCRLLQECKPKWFLLENVKMAKDHRDVISSFLGVEPIEINSNLVSAQNRRRLYWTNIPNVTLPVDRGLVLQDVLEDRGSCVDITDRLMAKKEGTLAHVKGWAGVRFPYQKSKALTAAGQGIANSGATNVKVGDRYYQLSPVECERLQTVPDNYTQCLSKCQRYKVLGNGWTVDVIAHILKGILNEPGEL